MADPRDEARRQEARAALARVEAEAEVIGTSQARRAAEFARKQRAESTDDADEAPDMVEIWAQRIGRGLALVAVVVLIAYLVQNYL